MSKTEDDLLATWDPKRRAALDELRAMFANVPDDVSLSDEVIADRRKAAQAEASDD